MIVSSVNASGGKITTFALDEKSKMEVVVSGELLHPDLITVDSKDQILYWMDSDDRRDEIRFERSNLDGTSRVFLCKVKGQTAVDLLAEGDFLFWTDSRNMALWKMMKYQTEDSCQIEAVKRFDAD